jgi:hypothetical protein
MVARPSLLVAFGQCVAQLAVPNELLPCQQLIHGDVQGDAAEDVDRLPLFVAPALQINLPYAQATKAIAGIWGG